MPRIEIAHERCGAGILNAVLRIIGIIKSQFDARRRFLAIRQDKVCRCSKHGAALTSLSWNARQSCGSTDQELVGHVFGGNRLAIPMVDDVCRISVALRQLRRIQAIDALVVLAADEEKIREIKTVCLSFRIEYCPDWSIRVDCNFIERDSPLAISLDRLGYGELGCQLNWTMLAAADSLEDEDGRIVFNF